MLIERTGVDQDTHPIAAPRYGRQNCAPESRHPHVVLKAAIPVTAANEAALPNALEAAAVEFM